MIDKNSGRSASLRGRRLDPGVQFEVANGALEHVNLIRTPPVVETVAQNPGVRGTVAEGPRNSAGLMHEGMDWGAVGPIGTRTTHANPLNRP